MASLDPQTLLAAVETALAELEEACAGAERVLLNGTPQELDTSIMDQRRLTHALQNAMDAAQPVRTPQFDERILNRLRYVGLTRDRHIARLRQYQEELSQRVNTLTRWKRAARKWLTGYNTPRGTGGLDQMR